MAVSNLNCINDGIINTKRPRFDDAQQSFQRGVFRYYARCLEYCSMFDARHVSLRCCLFMFRALFRVTGRKCLAGVLTLIAR